MLTPNSLSTVAVIPWRRFPGEHTELGYQGEGGSLESCQVFYTIFLLQSNPCSSLFFYKAFHYGVFLRLNPNLSSMQSFLPQVLPRQPAPKSACRSCIYIAARPLVLKQALETIATDQTHLKHLASLTQQSVAVPYGFSFLLTCHKACCYFWNHYLSDSLSSE